jgi:hypothetical protein
MDALQRLAALLVSVGCVFDVNRPVPDASVEPVSLEDLQRALASMNVQSMPSAEDLQDCAEMVQLAHSVSCVRI